MYISLLLIFCIAAWFWFFIFVVQTYFYVPLCLIIFYYFVEAWILQATYRRIFIFKKSNLKFCLFINLFNPFMFLIISATFNLSLTFEFFSVNHTFSFTTFFYSLFSWHLELIICVFQGIWPIHLLCLIYWYKFINNILS